MHGRDLPCALRPIPVRQQMCHRQFGTPVRLIQVVAVLRKSSEIDDAEVAGAGRIVAAAVGRGFADVVETCPDKLAAHVRKAILGGEFSVGGSRPAWVIQIVGTHLMMLSVLPRRRTSAAW